MTVLKRYTGSDWEVVGVPQSGSSVAPFVHVRRAVAQSITNAAYNVITFDTEVEDTDTMYDPAAANKITIKTAGVYHLEAGIEIAAGGSGILVIALHTSTTAGTGQIAFQRGGNDPGNSTGNSLSRDYRFAVNDTVALQIYQGSGGAKNTMTGNQSCYLSALKVRD